MTGELFIALQVEELPAHFVKIAEEGLREKVKTALKNIPFQTINSWSTPRHIAISIPELAEHSPIQEKIVTGPPWNRAFKDGQPTKVALGFARGKGVSVDELEKVAQQPQESGTKSSGLPETTTKTKPLPETTRIDTFPFPLGKAL